MILSYGTLRFQPGEALTVEDSAGTVRLTAAAGHDCGQCAFRLICDVMNDGNLMARLCADTHFVAAQGGTGN